MSADQMTRSTTRRISRPLLLFFLIIASVLVAQAQDYPAYCTATTNLNIRSGPGTRYKKVGMLHRGDLVVVYEVQYRNSHTWGLITYNDCDCYIAMEYVRYDESLTMNAEKFAQMDEPNSLLQLEWVKSLPPFLQEWWNAAVNFVERCMPVIKIVIVILLIIILLLTWKLIVQFSIISAILMGIGGLISYLIFGNPTPGYIIGGLLSTYVGLRYLSSEYGITFSRISFIIFWIVAIPFWTCNRLQFVLVEPWRYFFKANWVSNSIKPFLRVTFDILKILLYILTTPLRLFNAILYNIIARGITEIYDLLLEVIIPSDPAEGGENLGMWLLWLPKRIWKYPIWHGLLTIIESIIFTVVDTVFPAITMYHGTYLTAAQSITCSPTRNNYLRSTTSLWTNGTFAASENGWAGKGVYFGSARSTALRYAYDKYRCLDGNPVMIICRITPGKIINYSLAPDYVHDATGGRGASSTMNNYAKMHNYDTGEWWNFGDRAHYWEFCMFDWKNLYNYPWRIRPICVFNYRTGMFQHIDGGTRHWFFDKDKLEDMFKFSQ